MSSRRIAAALALAACLAVSPAPAADEAGAPRPGIDNLSVERVDGRVVVDFELVDVIDEEMVEQIESGIPVKFRHRIEVATPKRFWLSPRKTLARSVVETRVAYDALTRRYELHRTTELRRPRDGEPPEREESLVTDDVEEMRRWMTQLHGVSLHDPDGPLPDGPAIVRVESVIGKKYVLWVFPSRKSLRAEARLER